MRAEERNAPSLYTFPEQFREAANGNVLVANFSGTEMGVVEYTPDGALVGIYDPPETGGYRGVYELPNGNILATSSDGVFEIDRAGNLVEFKIADVSGHFIELITLGDPEPDPLVEIAYEYRFSDGEMGAGIFSLFDDGTFVDDMGRTGVWTYRPAQQVVDLQYDAGQFCEARFVGRVDAQTGVVTGRFACQDGSGEGGVWRGLATFPQAFFQ